MAVLEKYDWIIAIISIAFCASSFGNGANDVANSYATSVAARTLTMPQVGVLSMITEFVGAVALGSRVTKTIKNGIIDINRFNPAPATLILGMGCAEVGSAFWLITATSLGFPVSTTQTVVGALIGVGFASQASIKWEWTSGSVSQVAASWGIAPAIAAGFSAIIFATIKYSVHNRSDSLKWALRMIPFYLAFTAAILALFIIVEIPNGQSFEEFGVGKMCGIIFGVFFGCLAIAYTFFLPYFHRRLVKEDARLRARHIPLGPLLWKDDPWIYWPAPADGDCVIDYYESSHNRTADSPDDLKKENGGDSSDAANVEKGPMSPTRGFSMELGAAITVLLASRLGLPVSTTQCLTGATVGTALMNYDLGAVNWRQLLWIFGGWVLTLPCAGLVSGVLMLMALNTPHF
ncbi:phosphate permease PHO89 [Coccidioides immitis RMSCC 3703]|uniref:Phosphate transporter n=1 Tax=Coccidioides immitis RMSCC 3703 TaxID=454286 RepID=A0A0J8TSK6_COCIT|nr:phosphate permease PHO89 [Coccidioides immitis RMSCC 3703]